MTSTEIAQLTTDQVAEVLLHNAELAVVSTDDVQADMVSRILGSGTLSDAFAGFEAVPADQVEGEALAVNGVAWMRSAFKEGPKVYALLSCTLKESKQDVVVSMGGRTLMAAFVWAQQNEAWPIHGAFRKLRSNSDPEKSYWTFKLA